MNSCQARTSGTERHCHRCGYTWDLNDPEPPTCKTDKQIRIEKGEAHLARLREKMKNAN